MPTDPSIITRVGVLSKQGFLYISTLLPTIYNGAVALPLQDIIVLLYTT